MKKQTNLAISGETRAQLEEMSQAFGTMTRVVEVAIDNLHRGRYQLVKEAMEKTSTMFKEAKDKSKGELVCTCDPGKLWYVSIEYHSENDRTVKCPKCGHNEHQFYTENGWQAEWLDNAGE